MNSNDNISSQTNLLESPRSSLNATMAQNGKQRTPGAKHTTNFDSNDNNDYDSDYDSAHDKGTNQHLHFYRTPLPSYIMIRDIPDDQMIRFQEIIGPFEYGVWEWRKIRNRRPQHCRSCQEYIQILWPKIGTLCEILMECIKMKTFLVHSSNGFWIVDSDLGSCGFVARSWQDTESRISTFELWNLARWEAPKPENVDHEWRWGMEIQKRRGTQETSFEPQNSGDDGSIMDQIWKGF